MTLPGVEQDPGRTPLVASYKTSMSKSCNAALSELVEKMAQSFTELKQTLASEKADIRDKELRFKFYWEKSNRELFEEHD